MKPLRATWNFTASLGGSAVLAAAAIGLILGIALDDLRNALIAIAVFALAAISVAVLLRANNKHHQINREELDTSPGYDPTDFAEDLIPANHAPTTYDVTIGLRDVDSPQLLRGLSRGHLLVTLTTNGAPTPRIDEHTGRHVIASGTEITWGPSTTDTTGETR